MLFGYVNSGSVSGKGGDSCVLVCDSLGTLGILHLILDTELHGRPAGANPENPD